MKHVYRHLIILLFFVSVQVNVKLKIIQFTNTLGI